MAHHDVKIAVIGGSGLYNLDNFEVIEEVNPETVRNAEIYNV